MTLSMSRIKRPRLDVGAVIAPGAGSELDDHWAGRVVDRWLDAIERLSPTVGRAQWDY